MGIEASIPCICQAVILTIDELVKLRIKMQNNDPTVSQDLAVLVDNIKKYEKKDRAIIRQYVIMHLNNMSTANSQVSINEPDENKKGGI